MKKFRLTTQRVFFSPDERITDLNKTITEEIECDSFEEIRNDDVEEGPITSIIFYNENSNKHYNVFGDPHYKLEELI